MFLPSGTSGGSRGLLYFDSSISLDEVRSHTLLVVCYLSSRSIHVVANSSMFQRLGPAVLTCPISHLHCASIRDFAFHACRPWPLSGTSLPCHQLFAVSHSDSTTINTQPSSSIAYCIVDDCQRSRFLTCKNLSCPLLSLLRRIVLLSDVASYR